MSSGVKIVYGFYTAKPTFSQWTKDTPEASGNADGETYLTDKFYEHSQVKLSQYSLILGAHF